MGFLRFWAELTMWNKLGLSVVGALVVLAVLVWLV